MVVGRCLSDSRRDATPTAPTAVARRSPPLANGHRPSIQQNQQSFVSLATSWRPCAPLLGVRHYLVLDALQSRTRSTSDGSVTTDVSSHLATAWGAHQHITARCHPPATLAIALILRSSSLLSVRKCSHTKQTKIGVGAIKIAHLLQKTLDGEILHRGMEYHGLWEVAATKINSKRKMEIVGRLTMMLDAIAPHTEHQQRRSGKPKNPNNIINKREQRK